MKNLRVRKDIAESEEELNAPYKAEAEMMEKYSAVTFEDPGLDSAAKLYNAALSGIIAAEEFAEKESYYAILDSTYRQQYAVALLILNEEYGLELDEDEVATYKEILDSGIDDEAVEKGPGSADDYAGWQRVTIGSYSYAIPEEFSRDETSSEGEVTFTNADKSKQIGFMAESVEEELGAYGADMGGLLLDILFYSVQEEYQGGEIEFSDTKFAGFKAKRLTGTADVEGTQAFVDCIVSITDKDFVLIAYMSEDASDTDNYKTEFEQIIASVADPVDEEAVAEEEEIEETGEPEESQPEQSKGPAKGGSTTSKDSTSSNTEAEDQTAADGVDPELKDFLDAYEEIMNSYCDFMENYDPNDPSLMMDYLSFLGKYTEYAAALEKYDTNEMSPADSAYYLEVTTRVTKRLLDVMGSMSTQGK